MNPYDFGTVRPEDEKLRQLYEMLFNAQQQPQPQQQEPELPTGEQTVNRYTYAGLAKKEQEQRQADEQAQLAAQMQERQRLAQQIAAQNRAQQQQYLTPQQAGLLGSIVTNKGIYDTADTLARQSAPQGTSDEQIAAAAQLMRDNAHAGNNQIRDIAKAIGMDLTGYEDVGYKEAAQKLQNRKEQELAELMGIGGKYAATAEQYYNDMYLSLVGEGKSAREAKRIAGRRAQEYQSERVTNLRNAFDVHGLDGNYINGTGLNIISQIAQEMPSVANVYAQAYQLPTQAQDRLNQIQDKDLALRNAISQIGAQGAVNYDLNAQTQGYNAMSQERGLQHTEKMADINTKNAIKIDQAHIDAMFEQFRKEEGIKAENATKAMYDHFKTGIDIGANLLGLTDTELKNFAIAFGGVNLPKSAGTGTGTLDNKSVDNLKKVYDAYNEAEKNYLSQLRGEDGAMLDDKTRASIETKLQEIRRQQEILRRALEAAATGTEGTKQQEERSLNLTGNWNHDAPTFAALRESMSKQGFSTEQIRRGLYEIALEYGYSRDYAMQALGLEKGEVAKWQQ